MREKQKQPDCQYACPECRSEMILDPLSGLLICTDCGRSMELAEYAEWQKKTYIKDVGMKVFVETAHFRYIEEEETARPQGGGLCPAKVIPFRIDRKDAVRRFQKWRENVPVMRKDFMTEESLEAVCGIYVPFWLYDVTGQGELRAECSKYSEYFSNRYFVRSARYFEVFRKVDLEYDRIPVSASKYLRADQLEWLEPFFIEELREYSPEGIGGYEEEPCGYTDEELYPRAKERVYGFMNEYIRRTLKYYARIAVTDRKYLVSKRRTELVLLPVWVFRQTGDSKGEITVLMNGQTGKVVGVPSVSRARAAACVLGIGFVVSAPFGFLSVMAVLSWENGWLFAFLLWCLPLVLSLFIGVRFLRRMIWRADALRTVDFKTYMNEVHSQELSRQDVHVFSKIRSTALFKNIRGSVNASWFTMNGWHMGTRARTNRRMRKQKREKEGQ